MRGPALASHACEGSIVERRDSKAAVLHEYGESARVTATRTRARYYGYRRHHRGGLKLAEVAEDSEPLWSGRPWWRRQQRNRNRAPGKTGERTRAIALILLRPRNRARRRELRDGIQSNHPSHGDQALHRRLRALHVTNQDNKRRSFLCRCQEEERRRVLQLEEVQPRRG